MSLAPDDPRHGTTNGYKNLGCRCDRCRTAEMTYQRATRTGGYKRVPCPECGAPMRYESQLCRDCRVAANQPDHGTESRYRGGCRCSACTGASATARQRRRKAAA